MREREWGGYRRQWRSAAVVIAAVSVWGATGRSTAAVDYPARSGALASLVQGDCRLKARAQAAWASLVARSIVRQGDAVKTGKLSRLVLTFADGSRLRINENSAVNLIQDEAQAGNWSTIIELTVGQAWARVTKARGQFVIKGEHAVAASMGTEFRVDTDAEATMTIVYEGIVDIHRPVQVDRLPAVLASHPALRTYAERGLLQARVPAAAAPGASDVPADEWIRLSVRQAILMLPNGRSNVVNLDQSPEAESDWIRWNREQNQADASL